MWLISQEGFISIVADRNEEDVLLLRARNQKDLRAICEVAAEEKIDILGEIWEDASADYRWRARIGREEAALLAAALLRRVDYDNFKSRVARDNEERAQTYHGVWGQMLLIENEDLV